MRFSACKVTSYMLTCFLAGCAATSENQVHLSRKISNMESEHRKLEKKIYEISEQLALMQAKLALVVPERPSIEPSRHVPEAAPLVTVPEKVEPDFLGLETEIVESKKIKLTNQDLEKIGRIERDFDKAYEAYREGHYAKAEQLMHAFAKKHPHHSYGDDALFWSGESLAAQKKNEAAQHRYLELIKKYPKGNKTPEALMRLGRSYAELGKSVEAKEAYEKVLKSYPNTEIAGQAGLELSRLREKKERKL